MKPEAPKAKPEFHTSAVSEFASMRLSNDDLAPTRPDERTWGLWNIAALWVGMSVCISTYMLAASMI